MQIEPAALQASSLRPSVSPSACRLCVYDNWTLVDLNKLLARMQKETMTTAGSVDAGTHSHTLTLSFIQSRQGQEQGDKCYSPELKRNFEIKEMFAPTQCRGVGNGGEVGAGESAAKVMAGISSCLAWIKLVRHRKHKPRRKCKKQTQQRKRKAQCGRRDGVW